MSWSLVLTLIALESSVFSELPPEMPTEPFTIPFTVGRTFEAAVGVLRLGKRLNTS